MSYLDITANVVSMVIAVGSFLYAYQRASKDDLDQIRKDAIALEHRLTVIEQNQFTQRDRDCLQEVTMKMGLIWTTVKEDFPGLLKRESSPRFDELLTKAQHNIGSLTPQETVELVHLLTSEVEEAKKNEKVDRAAIAAFYRAVLTFEVKKAEDNAECV